MQTAVSLSETPLEEESNRRPPWWAGWHSLRPQILLVTLAGALIPMIWAGLWVSYHAQRSFRQEAIESLRQATEEVGRKWQLWSDQLASANDSPATAETRVQWTELASQLHGIKVGKQGFVCLINNGGQVVVGPPSVMLHPASFGFLAEVTQPGVQEITDPQHKGWLTMTQPLSKNLRAIALINKMEVDDQTHRFCWSMIPLMVGILLLTITGSSLLVFRILSPIEGLTQAAERLRAGDWSARVHSRRHDELGRLAQSFDEMAERLSRQYAHVEAEVAERTKELRRENQERTAIENSLRLKQQELEAMNNASPIGIFSTNSSGAYLYVNQAFKEIFGVATTVDDDFVQMLHEEDRPRLLIRWSESVASRGAFDSTHRIRNASGQIRWVHVKASPMPDGNGGLMGYVGMAEDVTRLKTREQRFVVQNQLDKALAQSRTMAEMSPVLCRSFGQVSEAEVCVLWLVDAKVGKLVFADAWCQHPYRHEKLLTSLRQASFYLGEHLPGKVWESGESQSIRDLSPSGEFQRRHLQSETLRSAVGIPIALAEKCYGVVEIYASIVRDVERGSMSMLVRWGNEVAQFLARSWAEQEQQAMQVQLLHARKMESIGQLAAGIAHEINTPTQYVSDNIRFLKGAIEDVARFISGYKSFVDKVRGQNSLPEELAQMEALVIETDLDYLLVEAPTAIQQSMDGLDRVTRIVRSMKDFSHPGTSEKTLTNLNQAIESTIMVASHEWKYVAQIETKFEPTLPMVPCFPGEFNQVILNLIINAAHAIAEVVGENSVNKGLITVSTALVEGWAEVRIQDTGSGIPEKHRDRIFDPFFTTKEVGKGTGQGLAIAHSVIVDKHSGSITFESVLRQGTTFIIRLPVKAS